MESLRKLFFQLCTPTKPNWNSKWAGIAIASLGIVSCGSDLPHEIDTVAAPGQNWTNYIRTAGHGLSADNIEATIADAEQTGLFGIEVDNDIPGRYESFLDPSSKLEALRKLSDRVHEIGNHSFVYIAGLECITANAGQSQHSFFKDHPDWVQRDHEQKPAVFGGGDAFWIDEGDEDVWISPYAMEWREVYMKRIREIAGTGIDGIFVDIPYWMTHFDGWEETWASFDEYTVQAFKKETGSDAPTAEMLGDFENENFRMWVDFRMKTLTEFLADINRNAKSVNPECMVIAEIYPNAGEEAIRVGADVYAIYEVVDVIAHEYSGGGGNAADKNPLDWLNRMAGMYTFRAFAEGKASLMLSYSWGEENTIPPQGPMKNLALSNLMAGTNHWDARGHVMSGSNDIETRKELYTWIGAHDSIFYKPRAPVDPIGIYFSPVTRTYGAEAFMDSFEGMIKLMLQSHLEFQILTPRTLADFRGKVLVLPDVRYISGKEKKQLQDLIDSGVRIAYTADTGTKDPDDWNSRPDGMSALLGGTRSGTGEGPELGDNFIYYKNCPGATYTQLLKNEFNDSALKNSYEGTAYFSFLQDFKSTFLTHLGVDPSVLVEAPPFISSSLANVEGKPHVFLANFAGLQGNENASQTPQQGIRVSFKGMADGNKTVYYLPFLGKKQTLEFQIAREDLVCTLPDIEKGGVVWIE